MSAINKESREVFKSEFSKRAYVSQDKEKCEGNGQDDGDGQGQALVRTKFYDEAIPHFWYSRDYVCLDLSTTGTTTKYTPPRDYDMIGSSYLHLETPELRILPHLTDTYRMCYTDYLGYAIMTDARALVNQRDELACINREFCVQYLQYSTGTRQRSYAYRAGKRDELIKWTTVLPRSELTPRQFWWTGVSDTSRFPIYKVGTSSDSDRFSYSYTFELEIAKYIRMQKFVDYNWVDVPVDLSVIEDMPVGGKFEVPQMYADLVIVTPNEKLLLHDQKTLYYVDTVVNYDKDSSSKLGNTIFKGIDMDVLLMKTIYGCVINQEAATKNEYFNCTDSLDKTEGRSPISGVGLKYAKSTKFSLPYSHFEGAVCDENFSSSPLDKGYFAYSFPTNPDDASSIVGIFAPTSTKLSCKLREPNKGEKPNEFKLSLNILACLRVEFSDGKPKILDIKQ